VAELPIRNVHRVVGTATGSEITRKYGAKGLPTDTIRLHFRGSAGQSFGAFIPSGMSLSLEGDGNDYVGKGLSGGKIAVFRRASRRSRPTRTSSSATWRSMARRAARPSSAAWPASASACATAASMRRRRRRRSWLRIHDRRRVIVLGPTGRNFAAGMSGGIAYVLDERGDFPRQVNTQMVSPRKARGPRTTITAVRRLIAAPSRAHLPAIVRGRVLAPHGWDDAVAGRSSR
jgi:glutamate synthase (ferredoxin)